VPTSSVSSDSTGIADVSRHKLLPFGWTLFTAVWLLFSAGFIVRVIRTTDLSPLHLLALLASMVAFVSIFLWLMLLYPFPAAESTLPELRGRIGLLLVLAALALYVELVYGGGVPYRFMYVVVAAAVTLPTRLAMWAVIAITVVAGAFYGIRSGGETVATSWANLVPFALIGVGMIAVSRLVITMRELQAARREIAHLAAAEAVAKERLRFARDLHDLLGHSLSLITLKSELAERLLPDTPENEKAAGEVRALQGVARGALREVREAVSGYRRPSLYEELAGACVMLEAAGISCRTHHEAGALPGNTEATLTWVVREAVTNVVRHSHARNCEIRLTRNGDRIQAEVRDDGPGPRLQRANDEVGGSGLSGLAERVEASGGNFKAGPLSEGGFGLRVILPLGEGAPAEMGEQVPFPAGGCLGGEEGE
jgi:two-component system sensor histidine kinase DesK